LNGQISNDLRKASEHSTIHACVLNAKGRINADVYITTDGESYLLDTEPEMRDQLTARLDRYIIADDVAIADVSDDFALLHVIGPNTPLTEGAIAVRSANRFGCVGTDIWLAAASYDEALRALSAQLPLCARECAETFRIERGIPRWGAELSEEIIPTEANLETGAIDYAKGCYIGQEVISRIKMSGQTNKRLCGLVARGTGRFRTGMRLTAVDGKEVGSVTSATDSQRLGRQIALGFVKLGFNSVGTQLVARGKGSDAASDVEIVQLPFS
jgi:folate-binding protein YgfZ